MERSASLRTEENTSSSPGDSEKLQTTRPTHSENGIAQADSPLAAIIIDGPPDESSDDELRDYDFPSVPSEKKVVQNLRDKYAMTGDIVYLNMSEGLESMHKSYYLYKKYEQSKELEYLSQAIKRAELAVSSTQHGTIPRALVSTELGKFLLSRYEQCGTMKDLEEALDCTREAVIAIPPGAPERLQPIQNLGAILGSRYRLLGAVEDLHEAIKWAEEGVRESTSKCPNRAELLSNLGLFLQLKSERLGLLEDIEAAIKWLQGAVDVASRYHPNRPGMYDNLGLLFGSRYEQLGELDDLEKAISWGKKALKGTRQNSPDYAVRLGNIGVIMVRRYMRFGAVNDLQQALTQMKKAVELLPPESSYRAVYLCNLGHLAHIRYELFGEVEDHEQALEWAKEGLAATPLNNPFRPDWLTNLGMLFEARYQLFGHRQDLEYAIENTEAAIAAAPPNGQGRASGFRNLGIMFQRKYERYGTLESLEQGIRWTKQAVETMPYNHPDRGRTLNNLALTRSVQYDQSNFLGDLHLAIKEAEEAVAVVPAGHPDRITALRLLGRLYHKKYQRLGGMQDLEKSIKVHEESIEAQSPDHPKRAYALFALSTSLDLKYQRSGSPDDLTYLLRILYAAWHCHTSPPSVRIMAAAFAAIKLFKNKMWQESSSLISDAIKMLPNVRLRSLEMDDQEHRVAKSIFPLLITVGVSLALQAGEEASHCLRLLEHGRGLIMGLAIDYRSDIVNLRLKHPEVFDRFDQLRTDIDSPMASTKTSSKNGELSDQQTRRERERAVNELEQTIVAIRELHGFERFNLPPSYEELRSMAAEGPIVILNSNELRSDAILVTHSAIRILPLPGLLYETVEERVGQITKAVQGGPGDYKERNRDMKLILEWLWEAIVEPVLQELGLLVKEVVDDDDLPQSRVWWIGVGLLALAPFHAAGYHSLRSIRNTLSCVISSYTPTIKALKYARQKKLQLLSKQDPRILTVTMPTTPGRGWKPLKNAAVEAQDIKDLVKGKASTTSLSLPSISRVLDELPSYDAIHFACHGVSDAKNPSNSALLLQGEDGTLERLTVQAISGMVVEHAQIAYLSACSTAENVSNNLVNESIFIASGFQLAGFSHVLATMWISNDEACRHVSKDFYKSLFDGRPAGDKGGHLKISASFHGAVKSLRDTYRKQPIKWASFIHTGA